jgi:hypothetical protein
MDIKKDIKDRRLMESLLLKREELTKELDAAEDKENISFISSELESVDKLLGFVMEDRYNNIHS